MTTASAEKAPFARRPKLHHNDIRSFLKTEALVEPGTPTRKSQRWCIHVGRNAPGAYTVFQSVEQLVQSYPWIEVEFKIPHVGNPAKADRYLTWIDETTSPGLLLPIRHMRFEPLPAPGPKPAAQPS